MSEKERLLCNPQEITVFDAFNQTVIEGVTSTLRSNKADYDHIPIVIISGNNYEQRDIQNREFLSADES